VDGVAGVIFEIASCRENASRSGGSAVNESTNPLGQANFEIAVVMGINYPVVRAGVCSGKGRGRNLEFQTFQ